MRNITIDEDIYPVSGDWNELTIEQLFFLISLTNRNIPIQELKVKMLLFSLDGYIAADRKAKISGTNVLCIGKKKYPVTIEQAAFMSDAFNFLLSAPDKKGNRYIEPKLTRNPFPKTKCGCRTFEGPEDGLMNITYEQFIHLQTTQSFIGKKPEMINDFISIIYKRNRFSTIVEGEPEFIRKMSDSVKIAVFWFYLGCLRFIAGKFPRVFSGGGKASGNIFENQMKIVDSLADGDVTKKPEVRNSLLYDALFTMELAIEKQEKIPKK